MPNTPRKYVEFSLLAIQYSNKYKRGKYFQSSEIFKLKCGLEHHVLSWTSVLYAGIYYTERSGALMNRSSASPGTPTNLFCFFLQMTSTGLSVATV